jgi:two-component system, NtrC family, response regulator HydG
MAAYSDDDVSTVLSVRYDPSEASPVSFEIRVVAGVDTGKSFVVDGTAPARVFVGKSPACELCLSDVQVSRRHASLEIVGDRLRLVDLDSTNGTAVGDVSVTGANLRGGELIRVGSTSLSVVRASPRPGAALPIASRFGRTLGASTEMRRIYPLCERLAASSVAVVLEGETGTGKEVLAESLHDQGPRAQGPFVVFDCTAVPPNLVEAELFGHERGAFTGAVGSRRGVFEQAHGGTLLIDEIGDLDLALQPKLLRAIERSEVRRVGGDRTIRVDVRVLAATRRDLDREVGLGRFRDDLFHRLAVARIELPPLRRRRGDVPLLARHFAEQLGGAASPLPPELLARWEDLPWPGNVRELRNAVARRMALGDLAPPEPDAPGSARPGSAAPTPSFEALFEELLGQDLPLIAARQRMINEFERCYIARVLDKHGGSVTRAAEASGVAKRHFQRLRARGRG